MPFDDDEVPTAAPTPSAEDAPTAEEALEEETQDFRLFASLFNKKAISAQTIRKGGKDFESHGTKAQQNALEQSRQAMEDVLSYTRVFKPANWLRGWYFPDRFADWAEEEKGGEAPQGREGVAGGRGGEKRLDTNVRDRVIVLEGDCGNASKSIGRVVTGQSKNQPARDKIWLLPEEALFLIERGSLDVWWPMRGLEAIFPPEKTKSSDGAADEQPPSATDREADDDEYDSGLPLSLEAAYSLLIGNEGERGKVTLQQFQVYSNLKRSGYKVLRSPPSPPPPTHTQTTQVSVSLWKWLFSLIGSGQEPQRPPYGPLVRPGLYRSYKSIYKQLELIPPHKPTELPSSTWPVEEPFRIHFHVWKSGTPFPKARPPPPEYYVSVVDAQESSVPTLEQVAALLDSAPWSPPKAEWTGPGRMYPRLKHGYRNVIVAVVDHGIINYLRVAEAAFGEESLVPRFDFKSGPRGGKKGGRRGGRGKGGGRSK